MTADIALTARAVVPDQVVFQEIEGQTALLHMGSERYFGLDDVATHIWNAVTKSPSVGVALDGLLEIYDVEADVLRADVFALLGDLRERGLVEIHD